MNRPVRAIVYGVGAMGSIMTRLLLDKGVDIIGAVGRSSNKVGRDLGDVAGIGRKLGVLVEDDPNAVLSRNADIAIVSVGSYLKTMSSHFRMCLEHGTNVITIEEETIYPWTTAKELAIQLDTTAKNNGVTLAASGAQDVFWMKQVAVLMGASHRIDSVRGRCSWNADDYGPEVTSHIHAGETVEAFETYLSNYGWPDFVARATMESLVADTCLTIKNVSSEVEPIPAIRDTYSSSMDKVIKAGQILGITDTTIVSTNEGPEFTFQMSGRIYTEGEVDENEWRIYGEPDLNLVNMNVPTRLITCTTAVNRIPDVINADPGLVTLDQLPQPRYRHHSLEKYIPNPTNLK